MRVRFVAAGIGVALVLGAGATWHFRTTRQPVPAPAATEPAVPSADDDEPLPVPPVPPRIAEGSDYDNCLKLLTDDPEGASAYADAWEATGGGEGATHCHALAEISLGNAVDGAQQLQKLAATSSAPPLARAQVFAQAFEAWLMADDTAHAYEAASQAIALSPGDSELLIDRAIAAGSMGRYLDAVDDLNAALVIDPKRADALTLRAAAWRHEDKIDQAMSDIEGALAIDPESPDAYLERGIIRQRRGDRAGAKADWQHAIQLSPDTATADLAQQNLALLEAGPSTQ
jgi:tetratricopeptide (TPR) repeat protein